LYLKGKLKLKDAKNLLESLRIIYSHELGKEIKKLAKKYPSLKNDFSALLQSLQYQPLKGVSLGNNIYKIRL
jgi:hypothetical protein